MVRADAARESAGQVLFVREERDREGYGAWELECLVDPAVGEAPCNLTFRLRYDGSSPLISLLEPMLRTEVARSADRLRARLAEG